MISMPAPDQQLCAQRAQIIAQLDALLSDDPAALISDPQALRAYETDALVAYSCVPLAVVLPKDNAQVSAVLRLCHRKGIKVVARGAGTSLAGGALPLADSIVLGFSRMNEILNIDYDNRTARVQAGVSNSNISRAVEDAGFFYAPDPSSQMACTIGGNVAMNSGGAHCLKYGVTSNNILGLTIITMNGDIHQIASGALDEDGYDLLGLLTGSEGLLAVVTEIEVRILPKAAGARPMMIGFRSEADAGACVAAILNSGLIPVAIEFMDKPAIQACEAFAQAGYPLDAEALLIIEVEGEEKELREALNLIENTALPFDPVALKISASEQESAAIWRGRKSAFGAMGLLAPDFLCMDGTIPTGKLPQVLSKIKEIGAEFGFQIANIFHAGDGNMHPLILYDAQEEGALDRVEEAGARILEVCVQAGGCITGEHGVGIEKRELMRLMFSEQDIAQQQNIKTVFDPLSLLNPGKVFPLDAQPSTSAVAHSEAL